MSDTVNIRELNDLVAAKSDFINLIQQGMDQTIVGQKHLIDSLLIALLSNGHVLLEGVPGLAKTLAIKTLAQVIDAKYSRIQFTPDILPADVIGTMMYSVKSEQFQVKKGPIFANFILADEINRAPPGDHRRQHLPPRRALPRDGHTEPYRAGGNLSASRSTGRPIPSEGGHRLSYQGGGENHHPTEYNQRTQGDTSASEAAGDS